ncbi:hypothetical protein GCM10023205_42330 [Yinghuangia aomiensis]|uniref:Uncharacterized protein n=1 Tax=Yinghuangia aomiensis TaxID=676205 RepID=A0ABP9HJ96_9ACTN
MAGWAAELPLGKRKPSAAESGEGAPGSPPEAGTARARGQCGGTAVPVRASRGNGFEAAAAPAGCGAAPVREIRAGAACVVRRADGADSVGCAGCVSRPGARR